MVRTEGGSEATTATAALRTRTWSWAGALVVTMALVAISFLNDPGGYLGTDTGGKTATLEAMVERGDWEPDIGYWAAEYDPDARFHPQYGTRATDDGYVQVTSLPMVLAARPLWALGGYRAALLLPIAGTVLAALAAAALARRLGAGDDGRLAFAVFGLASPLVVYGLDLWEHSLGVAAMAWAVVLLVDVGRGDRAPIVGGAAGALFALAATMRTEALVYTLVLVGAMCLWILWSRRVVEAVLTGVAACIGFAPVWLLNVALESALGGNSRTDRATGAGSRGGSELGERLEEGIRTTVAVSSADSARPIVLGVLFVVVVVAAVSLGRRLPPDRQRLVAVLVLAFGLLTVVPGLGFVPGLFAAFPVAAVALAPVRGEATARSPAAPVLVGAAIVALPVVWAFQFLGGAGPQWGGRYVLFSGFLLGVVGVVRLAGPDVASVVRHAVLASTLLVTLMGVAWLWQRSHEVADLFDDVVAVQGEGLVARNPFFLRESGPETLDHRWLSAADPAEPDEPIEVFRDAGLDTFSVLQVDGQPVPEPDGATETGVDRFGALGVVFEVRHYEFDDR